MSSYAEGDRFVREARRMAQEALETGCGEAVGGEAIKNDGGKPRIDLVPPELILGCAQAMEHDAVYNGDHDWQKGMEWSRVYADAMRYLLAWWSGEGKDRASLESNLAHVAANVAILMAYEARDIGKDDRS